MSGLLNSAATSPGFHEFHHSGTLQGLRNIHGNFNVPSMAGTLPSRNSTINIIPSGGMQQSTGSLLTGRFGSNNLPVLSQISHGSSHGQSGVTHRGGMNVIGNPAYNSSTNTVGGSIPGVIPTSAAIGNRGAVPGIVVSPHLGNAGSPITNSMGNAAVSSSGYIGRSSTGAFLMPGHASRLNLSSNSGSGSVGSQGPNRLMTGGLQQQGNWESKHLTVTFPEETLVTRRQLCTAASLVAILTIYQSMISEPVMAVEKVDDKQEDDGVFGTVKSLFDPNEKTKSGKVLPKAYLKSAREVLKTLRESLKEDPKDIAKFRRTADAAKESIRDYLSNWRGKQAVAKEESYIELEKVIRSLASFYAKAGPSASLSDQVKSQILQELDTAEQFL